MKKFCPALLVWFLSLAGVNESVRPQVESTTVSQAVSVRAEEGEPAQEVTRAEPGLYFPDYVDGGGWSVQLALSNVARRVPAAVAVTAYDQDGQPLPELFDSETTFEISPLGSQVLRSVGTGEIRRGWIEVRSVPPAVSGLLTYRHSGSGVEVGVAPVPLGDRFALFVEESSEIGTGLALFKPEADSEVEFQLRDEAGTDPFGQDLTLGNFQQQARTLPEWFDPIGATFPGDFRGLLFLRSGEDSSFAPLGLRFGKRKTSLSAVPGIPFVAESGGGAPNPFQPPTSTAGPLYFPDYVDGGGWSVQLVLGNLDPDRSVPVKVEVYDQQGLSVAQLFDSGTRFELPAQGSRVLRSAGGTQIRRGWIRVEADSASVRGLLVYRHGETGIEVGVAPVEPRDEFALFVEESSEIGTGLALFKPEAGSKVEFRIRDEAGNDPLGDVYIPWRNFRQSARTLSEWLDVDGVETGFLKNFRGLLFLRTEDGSEFAPLGLRFGKGTSALSAVPGIGIVDGVRIAGGVGSDGGVEIDGGVGIDGGGMAPPPTVTLSVAPSSIDRGQSATLRWSSTNAESVEITPDVGKVSTSGTQKVSPRSTTTYRITVRAADGRTATATVTVTVAITDRAVLEALYEATDGPNWVNNDNWLTDAPLGEWYGVDTDASGRVVRLSLAGNRLVGTIPPDLGNLTNLTDLNFFVNQLWGTIPPELGRLVFLRSLTLGANVLTGEIPPEIGSLTRLQGVNLRLNQLTGPIPTELGSLIELRDLDLYSNELSGPIPTELGSLTELQYLSLGLNQLTGQIPEELANLSKLLSLYLASSGLTGPIPPELGNLINLKSLSLWGNNLTGPIPPELGNLTELENLSLSSNDLTGPIPPELGNLVNLLSASFGGNRLTGAIPRSFLQLDSLQTLGCAQSDGVCVPATTEFREWVHAVETRSVGSSWVEVPWCDETEKLVLEALYEAANGPEWTLSDGWLEDEDLAHWHGVSTDSVTGRISGLDLTGNGLSGGLPQALGQLVGMTQLRIGNNELSGRLPLSLSGLPLDEFEYGGTSLCVVDDADFESWLGGITVHRGTGVQCPPLTEREILELLYRNTTGSGWSKRGGWFTDAPLSQWHGVETDATGRVVALSLRHNGLTGTIPAELGQLPELRSLDLRYNALSGAIPPNLADLNRLERLELSSNQLSGSLPVELWNLPELQVLRLDDNRLSGSIPAELGDLDRLERLDLSWNQFTGEIPAELGQLSKLRDLRLAHNRLSGSIPAELGDMNRLEYIDLSQNQLSGEIPGQFGKLAELRFLRLYDNRLSSEIPSGVAGLARIERLDLSRNRLTGLIPSGLGNLANLTELHLGDNQFAGPLPVDLGRADRLESLDLRSNALTGPIPADYSNLRALKQLILAYNSGLGGPLPDGLTELDRLERFMAGGTGLCLPAGPDFDVWFSAIDHRYVARCREGPSVYLTQTTQSWDDPVPLLAGEPALLRVFVTAPIATDATMPDVAATFYVDGSERHTVRIPASAQTIPTEVVEGDLALSANAEIPAEVIAPDLEMVIEVDPDGTLDPALGVTKRIPESGRMPVDVRAVPTFQLTLIPFLWEGVADSSVVQSVNEMAEDAYGGHESFRDVRTLLPVAELAITAHEPVSMSHSNANELLAQIEAMRLMEGGSGYWMGVVERRPDARVFWRPGQAIIGGHVSYARPQAASTMAHELGHNLGLLHAPCGNPEGVDPWFPDPAGRIGAWGFDLERSALVRPITPDLMSYCGRSAAWMSDYHFNKSLNHRLANEGAAAVAGTARAPTLLLWGGRDQHGIPYLEPAFVVDAVPSLPATGEDYTIKGTNADGTSIFSFTFDMPVVGDAEGEATIFVFALPVQPEWADELASITLSGMGGVDTLDATTDRPMAILRNPRTGQVRGFVRGVVAAPQNIDATVSTLSVDTRLERLTSRGIPDPKDWAQ